MRTLMTFLGVAVFSLPVLQAAQPQPQTGLNPVPGSHLYAASRPYLGVDIRDITSDRVAALKLKDERGVEVTMVDQDAPAGKAGIREHDVILTFNGTQVQSEEQLRRLIRETPAGRTVTLGVSRDGNPLKINVELADYNKLAGKNHAIMVAPLPPLPEVGDFGNRFDVPGNIYVLRNTSAALGVQTENLTAQLGDFFGVKNGEGVLVRSVEKGGPAEKGGLKAGDVIVRVGEEKLSDRSDLTRLMRKYRAGGKLTLGVVRDKREQNFTVDLPQRSKDSSSIGVDSEQFDALVDPLDSINPEIDSSLEAAGDAMAKLKAQDLNEVMREFNKGAAAYNNALKQYRYQFKDLDKELQKLEIYTHPML